MVDYAYALNSEHERVRSSINDAFTTLILFGKLEYMHRVIVPISSSTILDIHTL